MREPTIAVLTPPRLVEPSLAIAACRAGALGILDLEFAAENAATFEALARLEQFTLRPFGVKLDWHNRPLLQRIASTAGSRLQWVLLAGRKHPEAADAVQALKAADLRVAWEAVSLDEALAGAALGVDAVVLKGHESGGRVGEETSFILLQGWRQQVEKGGVADLPVWIQGGIGPNTAAACAVAGAAGLVLDQQVLLTRESPLAADLRQRLSAADGSETICLGAALGQAYRFYNRPGCKRLEQLSRLAGGLADGEQNADEPTGIWQREVANHVLADDPSALLPLGQDIAFARPLAERFITVGGIVSAITSQVRHNCAAAAELQPLAADAPLARSHGTRWPLVQGPMTRVSDTAQFAESVAAAGALPFLALALLRGPEVEKLLEETEGRLGPRPWGVGLLGFLPPEIRREQVDVIRRRKPPMALIAGGRPDQARELEELGIPTYLHVPSPGLLKMFLKDGARRFVFEGRECGGHVGPRTSFVLWETMCDILLEHLGPSGRGDEIHVVFAGGIHDGLSAAMVAALAAPLAERGVKIGGLMGTAYLFTEEAVRSGGIVSRFQREALGCRQTVLLETGPGHAIRCIPTPYFDTFAAERRRLEREGRTHEEIVKELEWMNIGRLRVASKGLDRVKLNGGPARLSEVSDEEQFQRGMYMIGQVARLRDGVLTMRELHEQVCQGSMERLTALAPEMLQPPGEQKPCDIAIIGMACQYPGASNVRQYWENILSRRYAVTEVPETHWDWRLYYDANPQAADKSISKWGGFLGDMTFDPLRYGITPASMPCIEPMQLMLLEGVRKAIDDAGYTHRPFNRERTAAVLGVGGGGSPLAVAYGFRTCLPLIDSVPDTQFSSQELLQRCEHVLPKWTEDSFPGFLLNVAVGRVANRFNFGGTNMAIDAACASSLAALHACIRELEVGACDVAVAMGADTVQTPFAYVAFSKTHALSAKGRCRPFDAAADGIVLSEGIGVAILKRLADAQRDGDRIYAVIKGVGSSSDGKDKGLTCPNSEGQTRALTRAYEKAGVSPACVELIEAHGTGTVVGDQTEAAALAGLLSDAGAPAQSCALGSVKSMIGHSKCAAGIAGLIKTTLALHYKVLPPTLVESPNARFNFEQGPLYLNTEARPWLHSGAAPRTAGVSAFGFGGTNFHVVLQEYNDDFLPRTDSARHEWPAELCLWRRASRNALLEAVRAVRNALQSGQSPRLADLAASLWRSSAGGAGQPTLAIVAASLDDLAVKLDAALAAIAGDAPAWHDPRGAYFAAAPELGDARVALLFPGQGSQYTNMLADLAIAFPEVRRPLDRADILLAGELEQPLGRTIYPASTFSDEQAHAAEQRLAETQVAQPAVGAASLGMLNLLTALGLRADMAAGHSYGEYTALHAAGVLGEDDLLRISHRRGQLIRDAAQGAAGGMAAVEAAEDDVRRAIAGLEHVVIANLNGPAQTVISGRDDALQAALERLEQHALRARRINVSAAFHSPLVAAAAEPLATALAQCELGPARMPVYSNTTGTVFPHDAGELRSTLAAQLSSPVRFAEEVEAMYAAGARVLVEVGPQGVLTSLVGKILGERPHLAVASDIKGRSGLLQLAHLLGQLLAHGVALQLDRLYAERDVCLLDLETLQPLSPPAPPKASSWVVNSVRSRPLNAPEPYVLGRRQAALPSKPNTAPPASGATRDNPALQQPAPASPAASRFSSEQVRMSSDSRHAAPHTTNGHGAYHVPPAATAAPADEAAQVMLQYQQLMARFLDTQKSIMLSYLGGAPADSFGASAPPAAALSMPAPATNGHLPPAAVDLHPPAPQPPAHALPQPAPAEEMLQPASAATRSATGAPQPPAIDRNWLQTQLVDMVSQRTGYPPEMLDLDLDLEADLGIDSIKRVEILGTLTEALGGAEALSGDASQGIELERLTGIKTLRGIIDYLDGMLGKPPAQTATPQTATPAASVQPSLNGDSHNGEVNDHAAEVEIQRGLVEVVDVPLPSASLVIPRGAIVVTDDGRGVAEELADRLADFGQRIVMLRMAPGPAQQLDADVFAANLIDPASVEQVLSLIKAEAGNIGGLMHLLPLATPAAEESLVDRARREVESLYLLARALEDDLTAAGQQGGAVLLAATCMGGRLGFGDEPLSDGMFPGQGGILGFIKCLGMEWPDVLVRAVDLDGSASASEMAASLLDEMGDADGPLEVGHQGRRRVTWRPVAAPLDTGRAEPLELAPGCTVLVTGGARGITAEVAIELARRHQPNLVLIGRSPEPSAEEAAETAGLSDPPQMKAALIEQARRGDKAVTPSDIEAQFHRLVRDREIRANLQRMRAAGSQVIYRQVDARQRDALARLLDEVKTRYGGIDGVIHGAGVIEDKLVRDKTPDSFRRVFSTKVDSTFNLWQLLDPARLKFFVLFASIASRYGNVGQSDYAAANEVLSKLAAYLDQRWPGRVVSIAWGPWSEIGMVSDLAGRLEARGLKLISTDVGPRMLADELEYGRKGQTEVLIAGGAEHVAQPKRSGETMEDLRALAATNR